jgi:hypothetical protein
MTVGQQPSPVDPNEATILDNETTNGRCQPMLAWAPELIKKVRVQLDIH